MKSRHILLTRLLTFSIVGLIVTGGYATAQNRPACASIATPGSIAWADTFFNATFSLAQESDGNVTGTGKFYCGDTYSVLIGSSEGNGQFVVHFRDKNSSPSSGCALEDDFTMTVSGSGCAQATGTFTESDASGPISDTWTDGSGVLPTGETTPISYGNKINYPAILLFWQNIAPTTYNFQGRLVNESFPNGSSTNCKGVSPPFLSIAGNTYPLTNSAANGGTPVNGITTGYADQIGFQDTEEVDEIRELGDAPCTFSATQLMTIDTATSTYQYQTNGITYTISPTTITATRGGTPQTVQLLSVSAEVLPAVIDVLLLQSVSH